MEWTVPNIKHDHSNYPQILCDINYYFDYKTHT
jgi:hypothetical protein